MSCEIIAFTNIEDLAITDLGITLYSNKPNRLDTLYSKHRIANSTDLASALASGLIQLQYGNKQIGLLSELCHSNGGNNSCWLEEFKIPELVEGISSYWLINRQINTNHSLEFISQSSQEFTVIVRIDEQIAQLPYQLVEGQRLKIAIEKPDNTKLTNASITIAYCQELNGSLQQQQLVMQEYSLHNGEHFADIDYTIEPIEITRQLRIHSISSNADYEAYFQEPGFSEWQQLQINKVLLPGYKVRYRYTTSNVAKPTINIIYDLSNNFN